MKTSIELRTVIAALDAACLDAGKELGDAEHRHRLATRSALLNGAYDGADRTAAAVAEARQAYGQAKIARDEGAALLAEAVARERAEREAAIRKEIAATAARVIVLADEADHAIALAVGKLRAAIQAEADARRLCEQGLHHPAYGAVCVPEAISDLAAFLRSLRSGVPADFKAFAADRAATGAKRINAAAGI